MQSIAPRRQYWWHLVDQTRVTWDDGFLDDALQDRQPRTEFSAGGKNRFVPTKVETMNLETIVAIAAVIQGITAVVICVATVVYTRLTSRMLEAGIEPKLAASMTGPPNDVVVVLTNESGCKLVDIQFSISIGFLEDGEPYHFRSSIFSTAAKMLRPGESTMPVQFDLDAAEREAADGFPDSVTVDYGSTTVEYSFVREADHRRFCYQQDPTIIIFEPSGKQQYILLDNAKQIPTNKSIVLPRKKKAQAV